MPRWNMHTYSIVLIGWKFWLLKKLTFVIIIALFNHAKNYNIYEKGPITKVVGEFMMMMFKGVEKNCSVKKFFKYEESFTTHWYAVEKYFFPTIECLLLYILLIKVSVIQ